MDDLPDLKSLAEHDPVAWQRLFDSLFPVALRAVNSKLGAHLPHMVEDVASEAVADLASKVRSVRSEKLLPALLIQIGRNKSVDEIRRHYSLKGGAGRIDSIEGKEDEAGKMPANESPEEEMRHKEVVGMAAVVLENFEPKKRAVLVDFYVHEMKQSEISAKHSIPMGSIGAYLRRGLDALRKELDRRPRLSMEIRELIGLPARAVKLLLCLV